MIDPFKEKTINRLKKAKGQIEGIIKMINEEKYCIDILTQILALQGSLKGVSKMVLESHLNTCGSKIASNNTQKKQQFISELVRAFSLSNK